MTYVTDRVVEQNAFLSNQLYSPADDIQDYLNSFGSFPNFVAVKGEDTKPEIKMSSVKVSVFSLDQKSLGRPIGEIEMPCEIDATATSSDALAKLELALWYHEWWFKET